MNPIPPLLTRALPAEGEPPMPSDAPAACGPLPRVQAPSFLTMGRWALDPGTDTVTWDSSLRELLHLPEGSHGGGLADLLGAFQASDAARLAWHVRRPRPSGGRDARSLRLARPGGPSGEIECRLVWAPAGEGPTVSGACLPALDAWDPSAALPEDTAGEVRAVLLDTVQALARTLERRDPYTSGHQKRVADLSVGIARRLGLPENDVTGIRLAAMVHDIGTLFVPAELFNRPGSLTAPEFDLIRTHAQLGHDLLKEIRFPWPVARAVLEHHERLDGSGYPRGLRGDAICREARILAVADVVDAITSDRPHRKGLGMQAAVDEIRDRAGTAYDAEVVAACLRHLSAAPMESPRASVR